MVKGSGMAGGRLRHLLGCHRLPFGYRKVSMEAVMTRRLACALTVAMLGVLTPFGASAATRNCDVLQTYPNHPGPGPIYEGVSMMPNVAPGQAPVAQWTCFFVNRDFVRSVAVRLLTADGAPSRYATIDVTIARDTYPDQTQIKVTFQRTRPLKRPETGLKVHYKIEFRRD